MHDLISAESEESISKELFGSKLPPSLGPASRIFSLWLRQSSLDFFLDIPELFYSFAFYLLSKKRLPRLGSPFQIFRLVLENLKDLSTHVCQSDHSAQSNWTVPALLSPGGKNILGGIPPSAVDWLIHSASRDLATLDSDRSNGVVAILIKKRSAASFIHHQVKKSCLKCL